MSACKKTAQCPGYSLVEVLVAASVLMIAIAAAGAMALMVVSQQETNARIGRALNYQEQAARLYQLGIASDAITGLLPPENSVESLVFTNESVVAYAGVGNVEQADCEVVFQPNAATTGWVADSWSAGDVSTLQTNTVVVVRPTTR